MGHRSENVGVPQGPVVPPAVLGGVDQALRAAETLPADAARLLTQAVLCAFDNLTTLAVDAILLFAAAFKAWRVHVAYRVGMK